MNAVQEIWELGFTCADSELLLYKLCLLCLGVALVVSMTHDASLERMDTTLQYVFRLGHLVHH
jgi:hypothetical protein